MCHRNPGWVERFARGLRLDCGEVNSMDYGPWSMVGVNSKQRAVEWRGLTPHEHLESNCVREQHNCRSWTAGHGTSVVSIQQRLVPSHALCIPAMRLFKRSTSNIDRQT